MIIKSGDVTAVVLTIGEDYVNRAIDSIKKQTPPVEDIIVVKNITPFYKALNYGASKVNTDYFIQVDSDMILDENCVYSLRSCFESKVGIVIGHLRDTMMGRIVGIKMFNKKCFDIAQFNNSISPDTDFNDEIQRENWETIYCLNYNSNNTWHTFGVHAPNYDFNYTFNKYLLLGRRYIYRKSYRGLFWHYSKIINSSHHMALVAQIALLNGVFSNYFTDQLKLNFLPKELLYLKELMESSINNEYLRFDIDNINDKSLRAIFEGSYNFGIFLSKKKSFTNFDRYLKMLNQKNDKLAFIASIGLCNGIFSDSSHYFKIESYYKLVEEIYTDIERKWKVKKHI